MPFSHCPNVRCAYTIVLSLVFVGEAANAVLLIGFEATLIPVSVGIDVFALALSDAICVITIVLVIVGIDCVALACVVAG